TVAASSSPSVFEEPGACSAAVGSAEIGLPAPTGTVTFNVDGTNQTPVPLDSAGSATFSTSTLSVGPHTITAAYSGDPNDAASNRSEERRVGKASTSPRSSANPTKQSFA